MIDWSKPIVWTDGTKAEIVPESDYWGKVGIYVDRDHMPAGVRFNGHPWTDRQGRTYLWVIKQHGCLSDPASGIHARIENVEDVEARAAMEAMSAW